MPRFKSELSTSEVRLGSFLPFLFPKHLKKAFMGQNGTRKDHVLPSPGCGVGAVTGVESHSYVGFSSKRVMRQRPTFLIMENNRKVPFAQKIKTLFLKC